MENKNLPSGTSMIDHRMRIILGLTTTEYCMLFFIIDMKNKHKEVRYDDVTKFMGLTNDQINTVWYSLNKKGMIKYDNQFFVNSSVLLKIKEIENVSFEKEFEEFWTEEKNGKRVSCWPGPRKEAYNKFIIARKKYSFEFIMTQRKNYFELLKQQTYRQKMIATRFLNVNTGQIEEDWSFYNKDNKEAPVEQKLTIDQKLNLYK